MEVTEIEKKRFSRKWTDEEKRYLISHKSDGAYLLAEALGRSVASVQIMACRLGVSLRSDLGEICPVCGQARIHKGSFAGRRGMCSACWEKEKARSLLERKRFLSARREYERSKWEGRSHG